MPIIGWESCERMHVIIFELCVVLLQNVTSAGLVRPGSRRFGAASGKSRFHSRRSLVTEARNFGIVGIEELGEHDQVAAKHSCGCLTGTE